MVMRALIVDDHTLVRHGLALILQDSFDGAEILEAGSAEEALQILETETVDVAMLDVRMPEMDGIELLKRVKAEWPDIPVIMLTTFDHTKYARAALAEGAAGYMLKDSSPEDLAQAISVAMSGGGNVLSSKVIQNLFDEMNPANQAAQPQVSNLTTRETEILLLLVEGQSNKEISERLYLSEKTVKAHLAAVFRKLGVSNRTQAAMAALSMGIADANPVAEGAPVASPTSPAVVSPIKT
jgi:two-component system response regulator DegU